MGQPHSEITPELAAWISRQRLFFVASAPLAGDGHVNVSPKGLDSFRVLGPREVAYLDLTGSGAETMAHLRENGRITVMFCAMMGGPVTGASMNPARSLAPALFEGRLDVLWIYLVGPFSGAIFAACLYGYIRRENLL